jgi:ribonuclease P protein component
MFILPIGSRQEILRARKNPEKVYNGDTFTIYAHPTPLRRTEKTGGTKDFIRCIVVVSKKIHKDAVVRNKVRRRLREIFRKIDTAALRNNYDYQIFVRQSVLKRKFSELEKELTKGVGACNYPNPELPTNNKNI